MISVKNILIIYFKLLEDVIMSDFRVLATLLLVCSLCCKSFANGIFFYTPQSFLTPIST